MLGRFLFRWRGVIGALAFGVVFWLARPTFGSCLSGLPIILAGLAIRFWASGYIGMSGRVREIGGRREERGRPLGRIVSGPYQILRHPLYVGNLLLVVGMLVALRPAVWLAAGVLAGFVVEYAIIIAAEERELAGRRVQSPESRVQSAELQAAEERDLTGRRSQRSDARCEMLEVRDGEESEPADGRGQKSEVRRQRAGVQTGRQSPESIGEEQGTGAGENRGQSLGALASDSARYSPRFPQSPESFLLSRALCEWRTWVVTGVGYGLALLKAIATR